MGGFGGKTDSWDKPIFEYRSLTSIFGDQLAARVGDLIGYLNQPRPYSPTHRPRTRRGFGEPREAFADPNRTEGG
jgi:hypothetical protein